jgi:acyl-coenzyme A thioesterase PaaI-like protein
MTVEYLRPIHSQAPIRLEGRLVRTEERRHWVEARIVSPKGHVMAEAKGLFVEVRAR